MPPSTTTMPISHRVRRINGGRSNISMRHLCHYCWDEWPLHTKSAPQHRAKKVNFYCWPNVDKNIIITRIDAERVIANRKKKKKEDKSSRKDIEDDEAQHLFFMWMLLCRRAYAVRCCCRPSSDLTSWLTKSTRPKQSNNSSLFVVRHCANGSLFGVWTLFFSSCLFDWPTFWMRTSGGCALRFRSAARTYHGAHNRNWPLVRQAETDTQIWMIFMIRTQDTKWERIVWIRIEFDIMHYLALFLGVGGGKLPYHLPQLNKM